MTSATTSTRILNLYKSRTTILELLEQQNYDVEEYLGFSINEIDAMFINTQLDMLITHTDTVRRVYVKYYISAKQTVKQIRPANLDEIIEDLYTIESVLTKNDTLIIIIDDEPNDTIITKIKYLYDHEGIFIVIHNIQRLQFNITNHVLVPKHTLLTVDEHASLMKTYNLKDHLSLPEISRFDPVAMAICMRPGQICKIDRQSAVALSTTYYRICV
jgi:DNA-directed RNA polymerase subunit H (RpoH/RPB5)